jgi:hypothetical protein
MQNTPQITHILVDSLQTAVSDPGVLPELKPHISVALILGAFNIFVGCLGSAASNISFA